MAERYSFAGEALSSIEVNLPEYLRRRFPLLPRNYAARRFSGRTLLYSGLDAKLASHTRFFGAAAMTTAVFADLLMPIVGRLNVSAPTREFLEHVSRHLETINIETAHRIERGDLKKKDLDGELVRREQREVQWHLNGLKSTNSSAHAFIVYELDRILNATGFNASIGRFFVGGVRYRRVLQAVRAKQGRAVSFAHRDDRECIGRSLIDELRNGAPAAASLREPFGHYAIDMAPRYCGPGKYSQPCGGCSFAGERRPV